MSSAQSCRASLGWDGLERQHGYGGPGPLHPGAATSRRVAQDVAPPSDLRLGEAYVFDDFDIEGQSEAMLPLVEQFLERRWSKTDLLRYSARLLRLPTGGRSHPLSIAAKMRGRMHSRARDRQAVAYHYDRSNEFFALWLDSRIVYTCAYFATPDDDLDTAQKNKLDYVCRKLRLQPGERLLDIGCGWGGFTIHAAKHFGVQVDGVTLSAEQAQLANERINEAGLSQSCRIVMCDFREVKAPEYDKLAAIGCIEHVGEKNLPDFFKHAWDLLRPGGVFLNHAIGVRSGAPLFGADFVHRYVFPDGEPLPIGVTLRAAEAAGFEVRDVENLKEHYVHTLRHWLSRLEQHAEAAKRIAGEINYRSLRLFLLVALREMAEGPGHLYQTLLLKPDKGRNCLPLRRADWYS